MPTISAALHAAVMHHQAGRLGEAEEIYRRILAVEPRQADARHLLGLIAHQRGDHPAALEHIQVALALEPRQAEYYNNLGNVLVALDRPAEAAVCFARAVELKPDYAEAHGNLGRARRQLEGPQAAIPHFEQAVQLRPDAPGLHCDLADAYHDAGLPEVAAEFYGRAMQLGLHTPEIALSRADACLTAGQFAEALELYRAVAAQRPSAQLFTNLGRAALALAQTEMAVAAFEQALELDPRLAEAHNHLGNAWRVLCRCEAAWAEYRRAIELRPDYAEAHNNLAVLFSELGRQAEARAAFDEARRLAPDDAAIHSNYLTALHYRSGMTLGALQAEHQAYGRRFARPAVAPLRRQAARPLRIGFVSPNLRQHPVGEFLVAVAENLDPAECELLFYSDVWEADGFTGRFQAKAAVWRRTPGVAHARLAQQIRDDQVDILFDLAGHTAGNRLPVFAEKPAPIQITWIGYEGTTGLSAMDYLLADRYMLPPEGEPYYGERVLRMPDGYVCYDPPLEAPPVAALPALSGGALTLASFNNPAKLNSAVLDVWAQILRRLPGARLLLKYRAMDDPTVSRRLLDELAARGVDAGRVELQGWSSRAAALAEYQNIDMALDPFPFSGSATTCAALWMGVPVITCPGETFASRHSLSHLSNVGLTETIARDLDDYIQIAVALANDLSRLAAIRATLRQRMAHSPLCDAPRFAAALLSLLRSV